MPVQPAASWENYTLRHELRIKPKRVRHRGLRVVFVFIALLLAALLLVVTSSLVTADRLMKMAGEPISPYATNKFSSFRSVSFPSAGGQISLKGWLIQTGASNPRGTIIVVHQQGGSRLPLGLQTASLYSHLAKAGFRILAFDLRHSGESGGDMSSFGYAEAEDVRAALAWAVMHTGDSPIILYGFGSGSTAIFRMLRQLQNEIEEQTPEEDGTDPDKNKKEPGAVELKKRVSAIITDSPSRDSDDFIKAALREKGKSVLFWLPDTTPYAIRLSLGNSEKADHFVDFTTLALPVMILGHKTDSRLPEYAYRPMIEERLRIHPGWTSVYQREGQGHLSSYEEDPDGYTDALLTFLQKWFPTR